ncbi:MAG: hypothetical protein Q9187_008881 [Circinaria calcarea]
MNRNGTGAGTDDKLKRFFKYSDTFSADTIWVDIPKQITFVNTTNPYADFSSPEPELDTSGYLAPSPPLPKPRKTLLSNGVHMSDDMEGFEQTHGLEALSSAATAGHFPYVAPSANMIHPSAAIDAVHDPYSFDRTTSARNGNLLSPSPESPTLSSNNNLNFILNHTSAMSAMIDPDLESPHLPVNEALPVSDAEAEHTIRDSILDSNGDGEPKVAFLSCRFSETQGQG